jgi:phage-related minor tail protein
MATSGGVRAGRAFVEAYLDASELERGLNRVAAKMKSFASGLKNVGADLMIIGAAFASLLTVGLRNLAAEEFAIRKMAACSPG